MQYTSYTGFFLMRRIYSIRQGKPAGFREYKSRKENPQKLKFHCKKFVFSYTKRSVIFSFKRVLLSALRVLGVVLHKKEMLP